MPADRRRPVLRPRPSSLGWGRQGLGEEERTPASGGQPQRRRSALEGQQERLQCATAAVDTGRWLTVAAGSGGGGQRGRWAAVAVGNSDGWRGAVGAGWAAGGVDLWKLPPGASYPASTARR